VRPSRSTFLRSIVVWRRRFVFCTRRLPQVERVVLNALAEARGFAAGYLCLRRAKLYRLAAAGRSTLLALYPNSDSVPFELMTRAKYARLLRRNQRDNHRPGTSR
jgi:hypothetical protein